MSGKAVGLGICVAALALGPAGPAWAQATFSMTAAQIFRVADLATAKGDTATAERAYRALIGDPSQNVRLEARYQLALLERNRGNLTAAAGLLRQVIDHRPDAVAVRFELARVLDRMGDKDGAWRQVRAIHAAGLPPEAARLVDRYSEALRAQRPSGASFEIALAPDSNINRATRSTTLDTVLGDFELSKDAKARSGAGMAVSAQAYRRFGLGGDAALFVRAGGFATLYKEGAFNDIGADLAAGPEFQFRRDRVQTEIGATQRWFGQRPLLRSARVAATLSHQLGGRTLLRATGVASLVDHQRNDLQDGRTYTAQVGVEHALSPDMGLGATIAFDRQSLKDAAYSTTGWRASLTGWRDLGRMTFTISAELGRLHADERLALLPERRADRFSRFALGATFRQLQFRGFAPLLRISRERNRSTVAFYDYGRTRTEIGAVRAF